VKDVEIGLKWTIGLKAQYAATRDVGLLALAVCNYIENIALLIGHGFSAKRCRTTPTEFTAPGLCRPPTAWSTFMTPAKAAHVVGNVVFI
jgi:hypothetical protein